MTTVTWVSLIIAVVAVVIAGLMAWRFRRNNKEIRSRFGPEYERLVRELGSTSRAVKQLEQRAKRVGKFRIRSLSPAECDRFAAAWQTAQERFVDDPRGAFAEASKLLHEAMEARGYPISGDFEERAADLSVNYPTVVEHYRQAHSIAVRNSRGQTSTEDLRAAVKHYRAVFEDLLERRVSETKQETTSEVRR